MMTAVGGLNGSPGRVDTIVVLFAFMPTSNGRASIAYEAQ